MYVNKILSVAYLRKRVRGHPESKYTDYKYLDIPIIHFCEQIFRLITTRDITLMVKKNK